jgi:adenosylcobinamide-phosphate synthase
VVGNFEDAIYAWRNFANRWEDEAAGIILAAGGGAMGVRFGTGKPPPASSCRPMPPPSIPCPKKPTACPAIPSPRTLQSTVGLVWRALLLWMFLLLLLSVAVWMG